MSASINDKITDTRNAARPNSARATGTRAVSGSSLACDSLAGWPTASKVHFVTYQVDSNLDPVAGTQLDCYGIVSSNSITSFTVVDGTDTGNSVGDYVEMIPTAAWGQGLSDALMAEHSRTGTHAAITTTSINNAGTLTQTGQATFTAGTTLPAGDIATADIANAAVTADKLGTGAANTNVAASETTTSTSYTALATAQAVTATVGVNGLLLVGIGAGNVANNTAAAKSYMSFVLSGANTLAAADNVAAKFQSISANQEGSVSRVVLLTGLTAGSTTVTVQCKVETGGAGAGTGTWVTRSLFAIPL